MDRIEKLKYLKQLLESGTEHFTTLVDIEKYFFGDSVGNGCNCKVSKVKERLSIYLEQHKNELENN